MSATPTFECRLRVRSYELDGLGHVNHAVYLNYFELARFDALEAGGFPPRSIRERGWGVVVVRVEVDYLRECRQGDRILIRTRADSFRRTSMVLEQEMFATPETDGEGAEPVPAARARVTLVWLGRDSRPLGIPDEVRAALEGGENA